MPYDPPDTVASQANTGYLSVFGILDNASPPNLTPVAELKSFKFTPLDVPNVDVSTLRSPNNTRELRPGMIMPGTVEMSGNWIGDASQLAISTNAEGQEVFSIQAKFPVQNSTKTGIFTGTAFVKNLAIGPFENDKPNEFSTNFQATGSYTLVSV